MHEQMSRKREREAALMQSLPGSNRKLRIQHYSKAQIPTNYLSETGGIEGLLIFNEGQNTFQNTHTDFMRILLQACNIPKVWNYLYTRKQAGVELLTMKVEVASPDEPNAQDCPLKVVTRSCLPPVWTVWRGTTYGEGVFTSAQPLEAGGLRAS